MQYIEKEEAVATNVLNSMDIIQIMANKYIADNPPIPYTFRAYNESGCKCAGDSKYEVNFSSLYPNAERGSYAYVAVKLFSLEECKRSISVVCLGGVELYCNNELIFTSDIMDERFLDRENFAIPSLKKGWNFIFIKCKKLCDNYFGVKIGCPSPKWSPYLFYAPFSERDGMLGVIYSNCFKNDIFENTALPQMNDSENICDIIQWYPNCSWDKMQLDKTPAERIFGETKGKCCLAWSKAVCITNKKARFWGNTNNRIEIYCNNKLIYRGEDCSFDFELVLNIGSNDILIKGFNYKIHTDAILKLPQNVKGTDSKWLYLGLFDETLVIDEPQYYQTLYRLFDACDGNTYWRVDSPNTYIRPCFENTAFGKWSYPHGVTLYGLIQAGRILSRPDIIKYVERHVFETVSLYKYSIWDKEKYGYPNINQQALWYSALDDVGSFGSLILEVIENNKSHPLYAQVKQIADDIANYITTKLERTEDNAFYRLEPPGEVTLWADDLYMGIPFLTRYYSLSGDEKYLDDGAKQFLLFKKYLFMEDEKTFSHVYDFRRNSKSNVPWGRGNGWVIFSLSEILEKMPQQHKMRQPLVDLFNTLCEGYLKYQSESGLWHQVVNDDTTYEETSSSAMIAYAFSRAIRLGISDNLKLANSAIKAWNALTNICIEQHGNIYGVCRGSYYSFDPDYYRELSWTINDAHGIGIVMLAGIEVEKMIKFLNKENKNEESK